jgi:hypothetical protein
MYRIVQRSPVHNKNMPAATKPAVGLVRQLRRAVDACFERGQTSTSALDLTTVRPAACGRARTRAAG